MQIEFYCPRWGSEKVGWDLFCKKVKDAGYDGVEFAIGRLVPERTLEEVWSLMTKYDLKIIPQHFDTYEADFARHFDLFGQWLERIRPYPCAKINSQTGKDFFSFEENQQLIEAARGSGLNIVHETHRNKFSFAAHVTKTYLEQMQFLKITLDASHWVCVAESFLEDQCEAMELAIERSEHIHARVGFSEGPQVPDPRVPDWQQALEVHLSWWDKVVMRKKKENATLTISPEFGPFPYMLSVPRTGLPVSDQWELNLYMMRLLKKRYRSQTSQQLQH
jgi:sugar phosphate isomerase/epimerase